MCFFGTRHFDNDNILSVPNCLLEWLYYISLYLYYLKLHTTEIRKRHKISVEVLIYFFLFKEAKFDFTSDKSKQIFAFTILNIFWSYLVVIFIKLYILVGQSLKVEFCGYNWGAPAVIKYEDINKDIHNWHISTYTSISETDSTHIKSI